MVPHLSPNTRSRRRAASGMTLVEICIAMPIVLVALAMLLETIAAGSGLREVGREEWLASSVAQDTLERMRNEELRDLFRLYNADPFDDPGGPGTAPGHRFEVEGLLPREDSPDGMTGEIVLPTRNVGTAVVPVWEVREDLVDERLGTPRDLNGDSVVDDEDHADDYILLPVQIVLQWRGNLGKREFRLHTVLSELR